MKTSNKLLLGFYLLILIGIVAFAVGVRANIDRNSITGNGRSTSETRQIDAFDKINASGRVTLYLSQGEKTQFKINADENLIPLVESTVSDGELNVKLKNKIGIKDKVELHITAKSLNSLKFRNRAKVETVTDFEGENIEVLATSGAEGKLRLKYRELLCESQAGSDLTLIGIANIATILFNSGASVKASDFKANKCKIEGSSGGSASIGETKELDASASSGASVSYTGDPRITNYDASSGGSIGKR